MARLIFIREISGRTFLHLSILGQMVVLRDFSMSETLEPTIVNPPPGMTRARIEELINQPPNMHRRGEPRGQRDPGVTGAEAIRIWHDCIVNLNQTLIPVAAEELETKIVLDKKAHEASIKYWEKVRMIILVLTALVGLVAAIVAFWR
jgi:hypothetical protein